MQKIIFILSLLWFFEFAHSLPLHIEVGKSKSISVDANAKVQVGSKNIVRAIDQGEKIVLVGKKVGQTEVLIGSKKFQVLVTPSGEQDFLKAATPWLKTIKGLKIERTSNGLKVLGKLYIFKDWLELSQIAHAHNGSYQFLAEPTSEALGEATIYFKRKISELNIPQFEMAKDTPLTVSLKTTDKIATARAIQLFEPFGISVVPSTAQLEIRPLIKTSVILAEVSKHASSSIGVEFPTQYETQLLPQVDGPESLMVSLKALESRGLGRVLASPTLNCRSGAEAEFHAGGEFPLKVAHRRQQNVQWKKHGVLLKVKPIADHLGAIQLSIETEISLVDMSQLVEGLPVLKTNRVQSSFDLLGKSTVVLSGLLQETWGKSKSGLFGLSQIPVLGALFRSEEFLNHRSELMVFVTPEVVSQDHVHSEIRWPKDWETNDL